ncbi:hypothetical protein [Microbulbifer sp. SH-1]|nr:hypothetical protein [Microbulbifer sp. SH-1]
MNFQYCMPFSHVPTEDTHFQSGENRDREPYVGTDSGPLQVF